MVGTNDNPAAELHAVLHNAPTRQDTQRARVSWLLNVAAALDRSHIDGATDLATTARKAALDIVSDRINTVAGRDGGAR